MPVMPHHRLIRILPEARPGPGWQRLAPGQAEQLAIEWAGERFVCLASRALYWPQGQTLFVADLHLGKDRSMRKLGQAVPPGAHQRDLERLSQALQQCSAKRLVILGDLVHDAASLSAELDAAWRAWRARCPELECGLVLGNHDRKAGLHAERWGLTCLSEPYSLTSFDCWHEPGNQAPGARPRLAGHLHPSLRIGRTLERMRLPCFWIKPDTLILPSFGQLTGSHDITPAAQDRVVLIAGQHLHELDQFRLV